MNTEPTKDPIALAHSESMKAQAKVRDLLTQHTALHYNPDNPFAHLLAYLQKRSEIQGDCYEFDEHDYTISKHQLDTIKVDESDLNEDLILVFGYLNEKSSLKVRPPKGRYRTQIPPEAWSWEVIDPFIQRAGEPGCRYFDKEYIYDLFEQWWLNQI